MAKKQELEERLKSTEQERDFYKKIIDDLNAQFQEKIHELSMVRKVGDRLKISMSMDEACKSMVSIVLDEINAESCSLMLYDDETEEIVLKAVQSTFEDESKYFEEGSENARRFKLGEGIAGKVAKTQRTMRINDTSLESEFIPNFISTSSISSIICIPLVSREKILGVLNLSHSKKNAFSEKEERILNILTNQISSSLSNLVFSQELIRINKELNNTLNELKKAQKELFNYSKNLEDLVEEKTKEINEKNKELKAQYVKISEADRLKSEFLSLISQELRTPLNSILGFSNILIEQGYGKLNIKQLKFLQNISNSCAQMLEKVEMLIEVSRIESGQAELAQESANLNIIIRDVLENFQNTVDKKSIKLKIQLDKNLKSIKVDIKKLTHVLKNIFQNVLKISIDKSALSVTTGEYSDGEFYLISIQNDKIDLKKDQTDKFLEIFTYDDSILEDPGFGFGGSIRIIKRIVELMGGKIELETKEKNKILINIFLPKKGFEELNTILVADDDVEVLDFLKLLLESENYKVHTAINGKEVLEQIEKFIPDLIALDLIMPKTDGFKVIEALKSNPKTKNIPIIVISGQITLDTERLYRLGADEFISKPFSNTVFLNIVRRLILNKKFSKI